VKSRRSEPRGRRAAEPDRGPSAPEGPRAGKGEGPKNKARRAEGRRGPEARDARPGERRKPGPPADRRKEGQGPRGDRKGTPKPEGARGAPERRGAEVRRDERPAAPRGPKPGEAKGKVKRPRAPKIAAGPQRSGTVALVGRPNVGKSTLLNAALEQPLAIVSRTPQTTRDALLGVVHHGSAEIALLDTPGLHRPRTQLGRVMNEAARDAARRADVVVFVTDAAPRPSRNKKEDLKDEAPARPMLPHPGDLVLLSDLAPDKPALLVLNKVDLIRDKQQLLPLIEAYMKVRSFNAVVPVSALREDGVGKVLDEIAELLPEGPFRYGEDDVTDKPARYFAAEYVREQILRATKEEVPHASAVTVDRYVEPREKGHAVQIDATIHVERPGQKKILIGAAGAMMKRIGIAARERIEELVGERVVLRLWVRVTPDWRESLPRLEELGYGKQTSAGADAAGEYVLLATQEGEDEDEAEDEEDDGDDEDLDEDAAEDEEEDDDSDALDDDRDEDEEER